MLGGTLSPSSTPSTLSTHEAPPVQRPTPRPQLLRRANRAHGHAISYLEARLSDETSALAADFPAVSPFVNDWLGAHVVADLARGGGRQRLAGIVRAPIVEIRVAIRERPECGELPGVACERRDD